MDSNLGQKEETYEERQEGHGNLRLDYIAWHFPHV
jgi:hypothetical protein